MTNKDYEFIKDILERCKQNESKIPEEWRPLLLLSEILFEHIKCLREYLKCYNDINEGVHSKVLEFFNDLKSIYKDEP